RDGVGGGRVTEGDPTHTRLGPRALPLLQRADGRLQLLHRLGPWQLERAQDVADGQAHHGHRLLERPRVCLRERRVQQRENTLLPRQGALQVARAKISCQILGNTFAVASTPPRAPMATCVAKKGSSPLITPIRSPTRPMIRANWLKSALHAFIPMIERSSAI